MKDPMSPMWRVGATVKLNVYEGDRPVCQCHDEADAHSICQAVNALTVSVSPLPWAVDKALSDSPWIYALGLKDGTEILFSGARYTPGSPFITLDLSDVDEQCSDKQPHITSRFYPRLIKFDCGRGLEVRIDEIAWAIDAPFGS